MERASWNKHERTDERIQALGELVRCEGEECDEAVWVVRLGTDEMLVGRNVRVPIGAIMMLAEGNVVVKRRENTQWGYVLTVVSV